MNIVKMLFGSHLYGTATPESDTDYKGVFLPSKRDILLNRIPKSVNSSTKKHNTGKNTAEDVDTEIYSLQYFLKLACEGQTVALDMLHAPEDMILESSTVWEEIVSERHRFYTNNLKAFIGYARKQASKYGVKGSRLNAVKLVVGMLNCVEESTKLSDIWEDLPVGEHLFFVEPNPNGIPQYQVCGRTMQATQTAGYTRKILVKFYEEYGHRAELAAKNEGIDWKAISHAVRAALQVKEILVDNTITFPLKDADTLLKIKQGKLDYLTEAAPILESLMDEVEELSLKSSLPAKVDQKYWDDFLIKVIENHVL